MVGLHTIAGESIKANFISIEQDIQFCAVYFFTVLNIINNNITNTLRKFSGRKLQET